ncbi:hypothetical protein ACQP25_06965 [Microtetraspora malaysiensis]|uniref:hypothetical protein n=1 Tax=Microtetraspora malaysiensis TaxID=161358 RepID=UPI003D91C132
MAASVAVSSKELRVGQQLSINWQLGEAQSPLRVQDPLNPNLDKGAHLAVTARVRSTGVWTGQGAIDSTGTRLVDAARLRDGDPLEFGPVEPGLATAERPGNGTIEVREIVLDLAPVESTWNDVVSPAVGDFETKYDNWWTNRTNLGQFDGKSHYNDDLHESDKEGAKASFTFVGTGVDLISDKEHTMGEFELLTDEGHPPAEAKETHRANWPAEGGQRRVGEVFKGAADLPYGKYTLTVTNKEQDKLTRIDAFRVYANTANNLAKSPYHTVCTPPKPFPLIPIKVIDGSSEGSESPSPGTSGGTSTGPSTGPSSNPSGEPSGPVTSPPPGGSTPTPSKSPSGSSSPTPSQSKLTTVVVLGSPTPTITTTITLPASTPTSPQVKVTPKGGARTGEAPETSRASAAVLIGSGGAMVFGGVFSGVVLLRRRAAHANDRSRTV